MIINLTPIRSDAPLVLSRAGDILTINGQEFDFGPLPEGAVLPRSAVESDWLASDVTRKNGRICLTLHLPHGPIPWPAPAGAAIITHPAPIDLTEDGPIDLPQWIDGEVSQ